MARIIITDLTRFGKGNDKVCTAGIDPESGRCIRPMPYLKYTRCRELNILPGAILDGEFRPSPKLEAPHVEDMRYHGLKFVGPCSSAQFRNVLDSWAAPSVAVGFGYQFTEGDKHIPYGTAVTKSLISVKIPPDALKIVQDKYDSTKAKVHLRDNDGIEFGFLSLTDLGFHEYIKSGKNSADGFSDVNDFISAQQHVYLRVGLSRRHQIDTRDGYWVQVNGIYTFPNFVAEIRCYT